MKCPTCRKATQSTLYGYKCMLCGAESRVNQSSGNLVWKRRGRLITADQDMEEHQEEIAAREEGSPE